MAAGDMLRGDATGDCCDSCDQPRSHDTSRIAWAKLMAREGRSFHSSALGCGGGRFVAYGHAVGGLPKLPAGSLTVAVIGCDAAWDRLLGLVRAEGSGSLRLVTLVDALASVTAEMHAALALRADIPAFAPVLPTAAGRHGRHQSASSPGPHATHRAENGCGSVIDRTTLSAE